MIILSDGTYYEPDDEQIIYWQNAFPKVDIFVELSAMAAWCDANPKKRKKDGKRFAQAWISRASQQERGISPFAAKIPNNEVRDKIGLRSWTSVDCLTHDFMDSEAFRQHCLTKYGQYVTLTGDRVQA
jgi:hypothetical protein